MHNQQVRESFVIYFVADTLPLPLLPSNHCPTDRSFPRLEVLLSDVFVNYIVDQRDCFCLSVTIVCVMIRPSHRCSFCLVRMQNFVETLEFAFGLVLFSSVLHFLSSLTATDTTMIDAADGYTRTPRVCHEATARVAYTRHELLHMNTTALCPPAVHRRLVQLQLCRSSPDPGPTAKKPKHRPFGGGRRKQGRCIPVLVHSLTAIWPCRVAVIWTTVYKFLSQLLSLIHPPAPVHSLSLLI